jgi:acetoin utilization protein AcuB
MLVGKRMSQDPITMNANDLLIHGRLKMQKGGFRRLPVLSDGQLVGIVTDRDMREYAGYLDRTEVKAAMSEKPITVTPATTLEAAAQIMLKRKIGGLPVVEKGRLVGMITRSDILQAFLEVMGALEETSRRIDFVMQGEGAGFAEASRVVAQEGGEVLGVGTYRGKWGESPVCYLRLRCGDADSLAKVLKDKGFEVLGVH